MDPGPPSELPHGRCARRPEPSGNVAGVLLIANTLSFPPHSFLCPDTDQMWCRAGASGKVPFVFLESTAPPPSPRERALLGPGRAAGPPISSSAGGHQDRKRGLRANDTSTWAGPNHAPCQGCKELKKVFDESRAALSPATSCPSDRWAAWGSQHCLSRLPWPQGSGPGYDAGCEQSNPALQGPFPGPGCVPWGPRSPSLFLLLGQPSPPYRPSGPCCPYGQLKLFASFSQHKERVLSRHSRFLNATQFLEVTFSFSV